MKKSQQKMFPWIRRTRIRKYEHNQVTQKWEKKSNRPQILQGNIPY